jgi:hypothetical protein
LSTSSGLTIGPLSQAQRLGGLPRASLRLSGACYSQEPSAWSCLAPTAHQVPVHPKEITLIPSVRFMAHPALRVLWRLRRPCASSVDGSPPRMGLPRSHQWTLRNHVGGDYSLTQAARCGIPAGNRVHEVAYFTLSGSSLPQGLRRKPTDPLNTAAAPSCRVLRPGGIFP